MAKTSDSSNYLGQLESMLEEYLVKKAPALPEKAKEILVNILPWLVVIGVVLGGWGLLMLSGLTAGLTSMGMMNVYSSSSFGIVYQIITLVILVVEVMALPGLFKRQAQGWKFAFYATLIGLVAGLFGGNLVSSLVGTIISLYLLFQIKSFYK